MELEKNIIIPFRQEYEFKEQYNQYQLKTSKNMSDHYYVNQANINEDMIDFFTNYNSIDMPHLSFGMNCFQQKQQHKMLNQISNKFYQSLQLHTFIILAKSMKLSLNYQIIIDFMKIACNNCLKELKMELSNNKLSLDEISNIMIEISEYFQSLEKITLIFGQNEGKVDKQNHKGLISLLNMKNIVEIKIQLDQINNINDLFYSLQDYQIVNHTLNKIDLILQGNKIDLDLLSNIFKICINLKSIQLDLYSSDIENEMKFLTSLQSSSCQIETIEINLSQAKFSSLLSEILNILFSSEYIKNITLHFQWYGIQSDLNKLKNTKSIFENLKNAKSLEYLNLNLQNNGIDDQDIKYFSEQIKSQSLRTFKLNIENQFLSLLRNIKNISCLESAIFSLPSITSASLQYSSFQKKQDCSLLLLSYSKQIQRIIYSYISFAKYIQQFMIFNPQHIFSDLYF